MRSEEQAIQATADMLIVQQIMFDMTEEEREKYKDRTLALCDKLEYLYNVEVSDEESLNYIFQKYGV